MNLNVEKAHVPREKKKYSVRQNRMLNILLTEKVC